MPALNAIANMIDTAMQTGSFTSRKFQISKYWGIADKVKTTSASDLDKIEPMIVDDFGEGKKVVFDDSYNFQVFHMVDDLVYTSAEPNYGPPATTVQETATMRLIFVGNRRKLQLRPEQIAAAITLDFPNEFLYSDIKQLQLNSCTIEPGEVQTDPYLVWQENWVNTPSTGVKPESILISVKYVVTSTYNKNCFSLCTDDSEIYNG